MRNMDRCGLSHMSDMEATGELAGNGEILHTEHLLKPNPHAGPWVREGVRAVSTVSTEVPR